MSGGPMLEVLEVSKLYGDRKVLDSITFSVREREIFGLLGPNGAGKTTLMEIIAGIRRCDGGEVRVKGHKPTSSEAKRLMAFNPQETLLYDKLSSLENLEFIASLYGLSGSEFRNRVEELASKLGIEHLLKRRVEKMSGGERRRVSLAASLLHDPELLILDEPTVGLDPDARRDFWDLITSMRMEGRTILISTHYMEEADELCDRVAVIDQGRIVAMGTPEELKRKYGGKKRVVVQLRTRDLIKAEDALRDLSPKPYPRGIELESDDPENLAVEVMNRLEKLGLEPLGVTIRPPTLEDVFLNLTGRRLE